MELMLVLPVEEQARFADRSWCQYANSDIFNLQRLTRFEDNMFDDPRDDEVQMLKVSTLGNLAYMSLHAPEQFRSRWKDLLARYLDLHRFKNRAVIRGGVPIAPPPSPPRHLR
ncbi:hypothetical protein JKP88DRAFT_243964 [Tribonema minus]|uniref:Uncharacterized protein n=1 Tax=Tribonema minus TaxID=303371 RepID=A0A835ZC12_9STRA|nr:hypothetical protein JKP88DRAFT_243964 [Tribonema minus]